MHMGFASTIVGVLAAAVVPGVSSHAATAALLGWNDLGMHCMDADYGVFSILPPYNTIHAQLISQGRLLASPTGVTVTYEAVADASGSINRSSATKTDFWVEVGALYLPIGAPPLTPDLGLAGFAMPGTANTPPGDETRRLERLVQRRGHASPPPALDQPSRQCGGDEP